MVRRLSQLVISCIILGVGIGLLLLAALGSDGYSSLINGLSRSLGIPYGFVNFGIGIAFIGLAWGRGVKPGVGTLVHPLVVGSTITAVLELFPTAESWPARIALLVIAFPVAACGLAGYLATNLGSGPTEAAALAFDPPVAFKWSYSILQGGGACVGWLLGADIGPGTLAVIFFLGPLASLLAKHFALFRRAPAYKSA